VSVLESLHPRKIRNNIAVDRVWKNTRVELNGWIIRNGNCYYHIEDTGIVELPLKI
jgi:hypothetical protein